MDKPEPKQVLLDLLEMYSDPLTRKHIRKDMKRYLLSIRTDLIRYGTLSEKQFQSIRQYLIYETEGTIEQVRNFFKPCIRQGKAKRMSLSKPKSIQAPEPNTLEAFL
jgi:hypothetical protein